MTMTNADRQKQYRDNKRNAPATENVTRVTVTDERNAQPVTLEPAISHEAKYATRTNTNKLNYSQHMTGDELAKAGLTANRVPIPGDHDYRGSCTKVDGVWQAVAS